MKEFNELVIIKYEDNLNRYLHNILPMYSYMLLENANVELFIRTHLFIEYLMDDFNFSFFTFKMKLFLLNNSKVYNLPNITDN